MGNEKIDIEARRPVWEALSTLFLDTDVSLLRTYRANILAASEYDLGEIENILIDEIYPICGSNLLSIAGEWDSFDPVWLERKILRRLNSMFRSLHWINLGKIKIPLSPEWRKTKKEIIRIRIGK